MPRDLAQAALGFRVHSGWAAVVAVSGPLTAPAVTVRRRIEIAAPEIAGSKQPYHASEKMALKDAEQFLLRCNESSDSLARGAIGDCLHHANSKGQKVAHCGILFGSGRPLGTLAAILASHALIHTAEGDFFRKVVWEACEHHEVQVIRVTEKELLPRSDRELPVSPEAREQHLARVGRSLGPPWRQDERFAMLAAWLALATFGRTSS